MGSSGKKLKDGFKNAGKDVMGAATGGVYNADTGGINIGNENQLSNLTTSTTYGRTTQGAMAPEVPDMPKQEDPQVTADRAAAEAKAKVEAEFSERAKGLAATVLGGGTVADNSNLKKKKLLGE